MKFLFLFVFLFFSFTQSYADEIIVDPAYKAIAEATGGTVYKGDADKIFKELSKDLEYNQPKNKVFIKDSTFQLTETELSNKIFHDIHGIHFKEIKSPKIGTEVFAKHRTNYKYSNIQFFIADESEKIIQEIPISDELSDSSYIVSIIIVPEYPFKLMAKGIDEDKAKFQHVSKNLYVPKKKLFGIF